jgi:hypothetical protein
MQILLDGEQCPRAVCPKLEKLVLEDAAGEAAMLPAAS